MAVIERLESLILAEKYNEIEKIINSFEFDPKAETPFIQSYRVIKLRILVVNQHFEQAIEFYNEFFDSSNEPTNIYDLKAQIQYFIAVVSLSKLEVAVGLYQQITNHPLSSSEKLTPIDTLQKNHAAVSLFIQKGDFSKAKGISYDNYHLANHLENTKWQAIFSNELGVIYDYLGKLHKATKYYQLAIDIISDDVDKLPPNQLIKMYNNLVGIYRRRGYLEKFSIYLDIMETLVYKHNNHSWIGQVHIDRGMRNYAKGNLEKTLLEFSKAQDVLESYGNNKDLFFIYGTYFEFYVDLHQIEEARVYLVKIEQALANEEASFYLSYLQLYQGLVLKLSPSTKDRGRAMDILQGIFEGPMIDYEITVRASLNYMELQISDLIRYGSEEIKLEFLAILDKLEMLAVHEELGDLLAQTLLFRAKLAFIELNLEEFQNNISRASSICKNLGNDYLLAQIKLEKEFVDQNEILLDTLPGNKRTEMLLRRLEDQIKDTTSSRPKVVQIS